MSDPTKPLFSFTESNHLVRIHLRLGLEDAGFAVEERADELRLVETPDRPARRGPAVPNPVRRRQ